jgi:hypothetical protein
MGGPASRECLMPTIAAPALTANRIDYWIPPHIVQYCYGTHPSQSKLIPRGGRRVGMLAIGKCLKDQYDALATPAPPGISLHSSRNSKNGDIRSARQRAALFYVFKFPRKRGNR